MDKLGYVCLGSGNELWNLFTNLANIDKVFRENG